MKLILFILVIFASLSGYVLADTTFFENQDDVFIMAPISKAQVITHIAPKQNIEYTKGCNREIEIIPPKEVFVNLGETKKINITVKNKGNCILYKVNVSLIVPNDWNVDSLIISKLHKNENQTINLNITPSNTAPGKYLIKITADTEQKENREEIIVFIRKTESQSKKIPSIKTEEIKKEIHNNTNTKIISRLTYLLVTPILVLILLIFLRKFRPLFVK